MVLPPNVAEACPLSTLQQQLRPMVLLAPLAVRKKYGCLSCGQ